MRIKEWGSCLMKKISLLLIFIILLSTAGCTNKDETTYKYYFKGESEYWDVYYQEKSVVTFRTKDGQLDYNCDTEAKLTAVYKYDLSELSKVKKIEVGYEAGSFKSTMTEEYNEDGPDRRAFVLNSSSGLAADEDGVIKVSISIDDDTETLELQKQ
jgi:hypothetical protein